MDWILFANIKIIFSDFISINIYNMTHSCHITLDIL